MSSGPPNSLPQPNDQPAQKPPTPPTGRQPPPMDADHLTDERKAGSKSAGVARTDRQPDKPAVGGPDGGAGANSARQPTAPANRPVRPSQTVTTAQQSAPATARQPTRADVAGPQGDGTKQLGSAAKVDGGPVRDVQGRRAFQDALHGAGLARVVDNPTPFEQKNAGNIGPGRAYQEVPDPKSGDVAGYVRSYESTKGVFRVEVLKRDGTSVFNRTTGELGLTPSEVQPGDLLMGAQLGVAVAKVGTTALAEVAGKILADAGEKALADTAGKVGGDALGDAISDLAGKGTADGAGKAAGEVTGKTAGEATGTTLADAEGKVVAGASKKGPIVETIGTDTGGHPPMDPDARAFESLTSPHRHVVDGSGRPLLAEGWVAPEAAGRGDPAAQRALSKFMLGKEGGTEASHLGADRFGFEGIRENLVPLPSNYNKSAMATVENEIAEMISNTGKPAFIQVYANYAGSTKMPANILYRVFTSEGNVPKLLFERPLQFASH